MKRSIKDYLVLVFKGMSMGAADVVPGVSGGTIAFISGIYEELIRSINSINLEALKVFRKEGVNALWKHINGNFLLSLFLGIGISVVSLAKIIKYLLEAHPVLIWSFFFGLVLSSVLLVGKQIEKWNFNTIIGLILGTVFAFWITTLQTTASQAGYFYYFICGAIAICAMILPGISGSFILVLLGVYYNILEAVSDRNLLIIGVVGAGAIVGLFSFSKVLDFLFRKYKTMTLATLTGFLIGSLNKIWPWKKVVSTLDDGTGKHVQVIDTNVLPINFEGDAQVFLAIILCVLGFALVYFLEKVGAKKQLA